MSKFARIENGVVFETVQLPDGINPVDCFHTDIAKQLIAVNDSVQQGWVFDGKDFTAPAPILPQLLSAVQTALKETVDKAAEAERLKYITPGTGQAMTYQQKVAEAQAFKATSNPNTEDYPILATEVGITAPTLVEVADTVLAAYHQWQQIGAMIEAVRLGAKRDIDAAENEAAAHAVVDSVVWPSAKQGGADNE